MPIAPAESLMLSNVNGVSFGSGVVSVCVAKTETVGNPSERISNVAIASRRSLSTKAFTTTGTAIFQVNGVNRIGIAAVVITLVSPLTGTIVTVTFADGASANFTLKALCPPSGIVSATGSTTKA